MMMLPEDGPPPNAEEEDIIKHCSSALYVGGADTVRPFLVHLPLDSDGDYTSL